MPATRRVLRLICCFSTAFAIGAPAFADEVGDLRRRAAEIRSETPLATERFASRGAAPKATGAGTGETGALAYETDLLAFLVEEKARPQLKRLDFGAWSRGAYGYRSEAVGEERRAGYLQLGLDHRLGRRSLVGVMTHRDFALTPGGENGALVGPYAALDLGHGLTFDATALGGGLEDAAEQRSRLFLGSGFSGSWRWRGFSLSPALRGDYYAEEAAGETGGVGRLTAGPRLGYAIPLETHSLRPYLGLDGVYAFGGGVDEAETAVEPRFSGGFSAGFGRATLSGEVTLDPGDEGAEDQLTGSARLRIPFN